MTAPKDTTPNPSQDELREALLGVKDYHDDDDYHTCRSRYKKCSKCGKESYFTDSRCRHGYKWYEDQECDCGAEESMKEALSLIDAHTEEKVREARIDELKQLVDMRSQHPRELKLKATSIVNKRLADLEQEKIES